MGEVGKFLLVILIIWFLRFLWKLGKANAARQKSATMPGSVRSQGATPERPVPNPSPASIQAEVMMQCAVCGLYYSPNAAVPCSKDSCPIKGGR
ncbi:MAG: hypothetical protein QM523_04455 [Candidatus Pacebacteria bacterium]|nr:hypothetical protein [Candidatus Paceibacterota bacterium]